MPLRSQWPILAMLSTGVLFGGGCSAVIDSLLSGGLDFLTGQVTSGLSQAIPLDRLIADLIRNTFPLR